MNELYKKKLIEHFLKPENVGIIKNYDSKSEIDDKDAGQSYQFYFLFDNDKIKKIRYKIFGCSSAIGVCSILSEELIGMTKNQVLDLCESDIIKITGELPENKKDCVKNILKVLKKGMI
jgi:nitrogen fixation NifU-like protein